MNQTRLLSAFFAFLSVLMLTGCPAKKKLAIEDKTGAQAAASPTPETDGSEGALPEGTDITAEWTEIPDLSVINFDYDSADLNEASRQALRANVAILKKMPVAVLVRVEGHCDEKGTIEYNIALGQRRANAVRTYYITAGLAKNRVETISYGEERPVCSEDSDDCRGRNRRAVTQVRSAENIRVPKAGGQ